MTIDKVEQAYEETDFHEHHLSRFDPEDFLGPAVKVDPVEKDPIGYTLKLDLTTYQHDRLIAWLKRGSYDPAIKKILYKIIGYDEAVEEAKKLVRRELPPS